MLEVLRRLDPDRYEITVIARSEGDLTRLLNEYGIHTVVLPALVRPIDPFRDPLALWQLYRCFRRRRFDIVHTHSSKTGFLGRIAARVAGVRAVFHTVHGLPFHEFSGPWKRRVYALLERIGGCFTDRLIFVNHEERRLAVRLGLIADKKASTIYNGVDLAQIDAHSGRRAALRGQWGLTEDDFLVGYVGRLWAQKDPQTLMRIIDLCRDLPVRFCIVGDGPYYTRFKERQAEWKGTVLTGWMHDAVTVYPAFDVLILPSLWEGLSMTLLEAMAFGVPLIASDIKGNRECVAHGINGYLCPPRAAAAFREAIEKIYAEPQLRAAMQDACLERSRRFFDAEKNSSRVIELYETALAEIRRQERNG